MYELDPATGKLINDYKRFHKDIVRYNNAFAWISEGIANRRVNEAVKAFTFRVQGTVVYKLGPLLENDGKEPYFTQIYQLDSS